MAVLDKPTRVMTFEEMQLFWDMIEEDHPWTPFNAQVDPAVLNKVREEQKKIRESNTKKQNSDGN